LSYPNIFKNILGAGAVASNWVSRLYQKRTLSYIHLLHRSENQISKTWHIIECRIPILSSGRL